MRNKKGDYKYSIIFSLILGLMVLSLSLYYIFNEIWSDNTADREVCRQSIQLRSLLPEIQLGGYNFKSFKNEFPLKCKTNVVEISENDVKKKKAGKIIAENIVECWALFDNGDANAFPSSIYTDGSIFVRSTCVPCARIHLTNEARNYLNNSGDVINIRNALDLRMPQGFSYSSYLNNSGKKFPAFNPASARSFDLEGDEFRVDEDDSVGVVLKNRLTGKEEDGVIIDGLPGLFDSSKVYLPEIFEVSRGDLLISYGIITSSKESKIGDYIPYLFYFQIGQERNPFKEIENKLFDGIFWKNSNFCESWEGIPA